jgi:hypothetical protein
MLHNIDESVMNDYYYGVGGFYPSSSSASASLSADLDCDI